MATKNVDYEPALSTIGPKKDYKYLKIQKIIFDRNTDIIHVRYSNPCDLT